MIKSKSIAVIAIASVLLGGGIGTYGVVKKNQTKVAFAESGYIIDGDEAHENGFAKYMFEAGEKLEYRYPDKVVFRDATKANVVADAASFLHYNDGSLTALNQGVLIDLNDLNTGMLNYYNLSAYATLENQGGSYALETQGSTMYFKDFMWKIGETKYLLASDEIVITMADDQKLEYEDYVELKYYNEGILLILSEDGAVRTVSSDCIATMENGMQVDLASRTVLAKENVLMSMEQMVIGSDDNIDVLSPIKAVKGEDKVKEEQIKIHIPTFEVIDGADGINGEQGIDGEKGKTGVEGVAGVNGMDGIHGEAGTHGQAGLTGLNGVAGTQGTDGMEGLSGIHGTDGTEGGVGMPGIPGAPGTPGMAGASGANGASGAAGSAGMAGLAGNGGAAGTDGNDGLSGDSVIEGGDSTEEKEAIELPTFRWGENSKVTSSTAEFEVFIDTESASKEVALPGSDDIIVQLMNAKTGREVRRSEFDSQQIPIKVSFEELSADTEYRMVVSARYMVNNNEYEKPFISKTFITSSLGLSFVKNYVAEDSMEFTVYKSNYSDVISGTMVLADADGEVMRESFTFSAGENEMKSISFMSDSGRIKSNTTYYVYLDEVFDGNSTYKELGKQEVRTLKQRPSLGAPLVVVNKAAGVFDMQLEGLEDKDNGIQYFRYELYTCDNNGNPSEGDPEKTMLISSNKVLPCEVTEDMKAKRYCLRVVASFFDNEKTVEIATGYSTPFSMNITGFPQLTYDAKLGPEQEGDETYTKHDRLVGTLKIDPNNSRIRVDASHPITISFKSSTGQVGQRAYWDDDANKIFEGVGGTNIIDIPIDLKGLRADDNYVLSVYAWADIGGEIPEADEESGFTRILIGNIIPKTAAARSFTAEWSANPAASVGFSLKLKSADDTDPSDYEAKTMDRILFNLYDGDKTAFNNKTAPLVGTKTLTADELAAKQGENAGSAEAEKSVLGQELYSSGDVFSLNESDFGIKPEDIKSDNYVVEIVAIQDYTEYRNTFALSGDTYYEFGKNAVPPSWDESFATNGFDIFEIKNNAQSLQKFKQDTGLENPNLPSDATIGIVVTSKYNNSMGLAKRFDYYALEAGGTNDGVTKADVFYQDIESKIAGHKEIEVTPGVDKTVPSAVFLFKDVDPVNGQLSRGHKYYFAGRVFIGNSEDDYFPDKYSKGYEDNNVMRSIQIDLPYLEPKFYFSQYSSTGDGTVEYHYWVEADDPEALVGDGTVSITGGSWDSTKLTHTKNGEMMGILQISNIDDGANVKVTTQVKSYANEGSSPKEVISQVYKHKKLFSADDFRYTVKADTDANRLTFEIKPSAGNKEPMERLTAMQVNIWKKLDKEGTTKEFILPFAYATRDSATAHLSFSMISELVGNDLEGEVVALYDTNISGMKLAEGSGTVKLAIETVKESTGSDTRYVVLEPIGHSNITKSTSGLATDSLFAVTKRTWDGKYVSFAYTSPLDASYNQTDGIDKKTLDFSAQMRGDFLSGPDAVSTFKEIAEQTLFWAGTDGTGKLACFEVQVNNALPTVDLSLGSSYNIITSPDGAVVNWRIAGHEPLLDKTMIVDKTMYIELYEVVGGSRKTLMSDGATEYTPEGSDKTMRFTPVVLEKNKTSYQFEITGLETDKTYAICFYYYESLKNKENRRYPLDYHEAVSKYYTFKTADDISLYELPITYQADSYGSKHIKVRFNATATSGFQVKYDFVRDTGNFDGDGNEIYDDILTSKELKELGIISNTGMITDPTEAEFKMNPGLVQWKVGEETKYFEFNSEEYYLRLTPVSLVDEEEALGDPIYIKLYVEEPKEPFFNVKATPGQNSVTFKIAVTDREKVIVDGKYKIALSAKDENGSDISLDSLTVEGMPIDGIFENVTGKKVTVKGLPEKATVTMTVASVNDMNNDGEPDSLDYIVRKTVQAKPLDADQSYDLGDMSILSMGDGKAALYFNNSVGLEADCPIENIVYAVTSGTTSTTYSDMFRYNSTLQQDSSNVDMLYITLKPTFLPNEWYTVYVKFLAADGTVEKEATFNYRG